MNARRVELKGESQYEKADEQETIKVLGCDLQIDGSPQKDLWTLAIKKMKSSLETYGKRNLSYREKILVAKALILSKIWIISQWIKGKSRMLPRFMMFQKPSEKFRLKALIVKDMLEAWMLMDKRNTSARHELGLEAVRSCGWPNEWKPYLLVWRRAEGKINTSKDWPWDPQKISVKKLEGTEISVKKVTTKFGNSDHLLVACTLNSKTKTFGTPIWKVDKGSFSNDLLTKELQAELGSEDAPENWDG
ncbi:4245_t:CDS:2, partial [Gigaspora rosea]